MKRKLIFPVLLFLLAFYLRTFQLDAPLADWHSWRQSDTASVTREFVKHGIDLARPTYQDLSSIPSGKDNPQGYRMVEHPFVNAIHAQLTLSYPQYSLVEWGRILAIFSSSLCAVLLYLIMRRVSTPLTAAVTGLVYAALPYNLFYGRVILPEPHLVLFVLFTLYFFIRWWGKKQLFYYALTLVSFALALLLKPTALVVLVPIFLFALTPSEVKASGRDVFSLLALAPLALVPYYLWRQHIAAYPEGIPAADWLFNGNGIRFKGAWFRWLFGDRLGRLILGYWGTLPVGVGIIALGKKSKELAIVGGMAFAALIYLIVIATGNVQHDYYQIQIIPAVAMLYGVGFRELVNLRKGFGKLISIGLLVIFTLFSFAFGWYEVRGYFNINNPAIVEAGERVDQLTAKDALVIAPYMGDTAFLFQTNRRGWPIGGQIEDKIEAGAAYYVTTTRDEEYQELIERYPVVEETETYSILDLQETIGE